jgi:hypothetical protein
MRSTAARGALIAIGLMFTLIPAIFLTVGGGMALSQHRRIVAGLPVEATIDRSEVLARSGTGRNRRASYTPSIAYRYSVQGREYTSQTAMPLEFSSSNRSWAAAIVASYPAGAKATAYYNPTDPADAFLVREYSFFPYIFTVFPGLFLGLGVPMLASGLGLLGGPSTSKSDPVARPCPTEPGWFELAPVKTLRATVLARFVGAASMLSGLVGPAHYFLVADRPYSTLAFAFAGVYAVVLLIPIAMGLHAWFVSRAVGDAVVLIDRPAAAPGAPLSIHAELPLLRARAEGELRASLICTRTLVTGSGKQRRTSTTEEFKAEGQAAPVDPAAPDAPLIAQLTVTLDPFAHTTSPASANPRYEWVVRVRGVFAGAPDYRADFPLRVQASFSDVS